MSGVSGGPLIDVLFFDVFMAEASF